MNRFIPALILGHVFLELSEGSVSSSDLVDDNSVLVVVNLEDEVSVGSLHSEGSEL